MPQKTLGPGAAKKSAKKAAKKGAKAAKKSAKGASHHVRRGYEHLHRVQTLACQMSGEDLKPIEVLSQYAQAAFRAENSNVAADLLRAAEHMAFAFLAADSGQTAITQELAEAIGSEFEHLLDRAAAEWDMLEPSPARALKGIYAAARSGAKAAWKRKAYGQAMEFARAADAVARANPGDLRLEATKEAPPRLLASRNSA